MKWGRKWGNYWGEDEIKPLTIVDLHNSPTEALVSWDSQASNALYHVYLDGKYYTETKGTAIIVQCRSTGRHWIEVFLGGPGSFDEDLEAFLNTVPGVRIRLTWTKPAGIIAYYKIYWDSGTGGALSYLNRTVNAETEYITSELANGTYVFRVDPVDEAGNQKTSANTTAIIINKYPLSPSNLAIDSYNGQTKIATMTFVESTSSGVVGYHVYHNSGAGNIDYDTIKSSVLAGNTSFSLSGIGSGTWKVGLRAYNAIYEEDNVDIFDTFEIAGSPLELMEDSPNIPIGLSAMPAANGTFTLRCQYYAYQEKVKATKINFYADNGISGVINYTILVATGTVSEHDIDGLFIQEVEATSSALVDGRTYTFAAKSADADNNESDPSETTTGTADATIPLDISGLAGEAVRYEK